MRNAHLPASADASAIVLNQDIGPYLFNEIFIGLIFLSEVQL
jgi:hypothetical protein